MTTEITIDGVTYQSLAKAAKTLGIPYSTLTSEPNRPKVVVLGKEYTSYRHAMIEFGYTMAQARDKSVLNEFRRKHRCEHQRKPKT